MLAAFSNILKDKFLLLVIIVPTAIVKTKKLSMKMFITKDFLGIVNSN
jgi:hypothetical protein